MDWSMQLLFMLVCASGLVELCYSTGWNPNLENAQRFEICVIGRMSRSMLFSVQEKSLMSKIFKETGVRMRNMDVDPLNDFNACTMLRLFTAALANLVFDAQNPLKKSERKQNFISTLELCSKSLPDSTSSELLSEVSRILSSMENKKTHVSRKVENLLDKPVDPSPSENSKSKKRDKRQAFQTNPPLDSVIAGVLLTEPSFGKTFKNGITKQDAVYYSRAMVEAGLKVAGYDYTVINEALNEVTNSVLNLGFMPQTFHYAFAISSSINTVLAAQGIANFADGIDIANALISTLKIIAEIPSPVISAPPSFDSSSSSSVWNSGTDDTGQLPMEAPFQLNPRTNPSFDSFSSGSVWGSGTGDTRQLQQDSWPMEAPFQLNPSWDAPPVSTFQFDSTKKDFTPDIFDSSDSRFPLNPSFTTNPGAPLPTLDFGSSSVDLPDFSSFLSNIPFQQETLPAASKQYPINPDPVPFPVDQFSQENPIISNQPVGASTDKSVQFRFDNMGSQEFPTPFVEPTPAQQPGLLTQQSSQAEPTDTQIFDSYDSSISQTPAVALPPNQEGVQQFTGPSIQFGTNTQESSLTILSDTLTQQQPSYSQSDTITDVPSNNSSPEIPTKDLLSSAKSTELKDLTSDGNVVFPLAPGPFVSSTTPKQLSSESSNSDSTSTASSSTYPLDATASTPAIELSTIVNNLFSTSLTTPATPTQDPYVKTLSDAVKNPDKLFELLMDEVNSSLKALNQTPGQTSTKSEEYIPVTTEVSATVELDPTNREQISCSTLEPLPTPLPSENASPDSKSATEDQFDEQTSAYAQRISSIVTSTIAYIRSGNNVNIDELCGKLNVLAFMVDIPPVDNCEEIAMIDFLLNVLNSVIYTLTGNR